MNPTFFQSIPILGALLGLLAACQPTGQPASDAHRDSLAQTQPDSLPTTMKAQLLADTRARLGEGALWHAESQTLYWIDIENGRLHRYHPATQQTKTTELGQRIGTVVPTSTGQALVALQDGIHRLDLATGKLALLAAPEKGIAGNRFNDGKCDPAGRFWAGTMSYEGKPKAGKLYCLYPNGHLEPKLDSVSISNGIVWSLDKTKMYYIDTPTGKVQEFTYNDATGAIAYVRDAVVVPPTLGYPDGSTLDREGKLWIALWNGGGVTRWDLQTGQLLAKIETPGALNVTSCAFGGPNLDTLYITSASDGVRPEDQAKFPHGGSLFVATPGVKGQPAFAYRDERGRR
jgi:sugar lactone lactonase YvrE